PGPPCRARTCRTCRRGGSSGRSASGSSPGRCWHDGGMTEYRIERDTMGEVRVPAEALYRAQTQRAVENFPISGRGLEPAHLAALAQIKAAAAHVNATLGVIPEPVAKAIEAAAVEVVSGEHADQFPVDVFQTGSGTSA